MKAVFTMFKKQILELVRPTANSVFNCHNRKAIKYVAELPLGLSHLKEHKFKQSSQDLLNPLCSGGLDIESTVYTTQKKNLPSVRKS